MALLSLKAFPRFISQNRINEIVQSAVDQSVRNAVNEAFLLGGTYTKYDANAPTYVREGYLYNPIVYSITKQRSDKAVSIPYYIKDIKDENRKKELVNLRKTIKGGYTAKQFIREQILKNQALEENFKDWPMEKPNANQSWEEIIALYETFIATTGNFYLYMLRGDVTGVPAAVYVLPSHLMKIVIKPNAFMLGVESPIDSYMLIEGNQYIEFKAEDVIHVKLPNPDYDIDGRHLYGLAPMAAGLRNLESSNLGIDGNIRAMLNSGAFGFLHGKGTVLNPEQRDQVIREMQRMHSGTTPLSKIGGSTAELGFTQIGLTPEELELLSLLNFDQKQIANVLGWDDILLNNDAGAKYDNYELALKGVVTRTTMPSLSLLQAALNNQFFPLFKGYDRSVFEFDYSELPELQPNMKELVEWLKVGVDIGAYNRDDFRGMTNFPKLETPEMEAYTVQNDVIPLSEAINEDFSLNGSQSVQTTLEAVS